MKLKRRVVKSPLLGVTYATQALENLEKKIMTRPYELLSSTELAIKLKDATAVMKTPGSLVYQNARRTIEAVSHELFERGRVETLKRADETYRRTETSLQEAQRLVHGDRNVDYGHPADNDGRIAALMRALFGWPVKNTDVWQIMALTKLSRERSKAKHDNRVDLAGYAEVGDWIHRDKKADA